MYMHLRGFLLDQSYFDMTRGQGSVTQGHRDNWTKSIGTSFGEKCIAVYHESGREMHVVMRRDKYSDPAISEPKGREDKKQHEESMYMYQYVKLFRRYQCIDPWHKYQTLLP